LEALKHLRKQYTAEFKLQVVLESSQRDTTFSDGSITSNVRVTIIGESPYIDQYGRHLIARAALDEPGKGNNIIFDASSYVWPDALSDFQVAWEDGPVPESSVLERITDNILQRIIHRG
jgi:hypothetical protein